MLICPYCGHTQSNSGKEFTTEALASHVKSGHARERKAEREARLAAENIFRRAQLDEHERTLVDTACAAMVWTSSGKWHWRVTELKRDTDWITYKIEMFGGFHLANEFTVKFGGSIENKRGVCLIYGPDKRWHQEPYGYRITKRQMRQMEAL